MEHLLIARKQQMEKIVNNAIMGITLMKKENAQTLIFVQNQG